MKNSIRIYEINSEYIKYLSNYQKHIFEQTDGKGNRKYIGIVLEVMKMYRIRTPRYVALYLD